MTDVYHGEDIAFDLYPKDNPKDGHRIRRLTSLQTGTFARREKNGTGVGRIVIPGDSDDAEAIDPALGHYVKVERLGPLVALVTSAAADDIVDAGAAHGLVVGDKLEFVGKTGGTGLTNTRTYYVQSVPSSTSLKVSATKGGAAIDFTTDITAGWIRKLKTVTGFFLLGGEYHALSADGTKPLALTGPGPLHYLSRGRVSPHSYLGDDPQPEGIQPLHNQGAWFGTDHYGSEFARVITEMTLTQDDDPGDQPNSPHPNDNDRLVNPLPALTITFDGFEDSNGVAWTGARGEFDVQVALEDGLRIAFRFKQAGLEMELDPDTFELFAYNTGTLGTDRTGLAWGAGVIRFQVPTDETIATSNVFTTAKRALAAFIQRSLIWAGRGDTWGVARNASAPVRWEGGHSQDSTDEESLNTSAGQQIVERTDAGDVPRLKVLAGDDEANGRYTYGPGGHVDIWDRGTVHSGGGTWDWNEWAAPLSAIEWRIENPNGEFDTYVEFGSSFRSIDEVMRFAGGAVGVHTHPPNPRLCTARNLLIGLADASLKASGTTAGGEPSKACDGSLSTKWSDPNENGVPNGYWAADLGSSQSARTWRLQTLSLASEAATALDVYGSNEADAWAWLTDGSLLSGDPAANDWTKVSEYSGLTFPIDTGTRVFDGSQTYRYWLFHATEGPAAGTGNDLDINEVELWTAHVGTSGQAARCDHPHSIEDLFAAEIDTTLVLRPDGVGGVGWAEDTGGVTDHGDLTGLADDDHPQYVRTTDGGKEVINVIAAAGATPDFDLALGNVQDVTLTDDATPTLSGATNGVACHMAALLRQGGGAPHTVTWPGSVEWVGGSAPTLQTADNAWDWVSLVTLDGGTTWFAQHAGTSSGTASERRILLADGRSTPFDFTDMLQMDDGSDFMWSD